MIKHKGILGMKLIKKGIIGVGMMVLGFLSLNGAQIEVASPAQLKSALALANPGDEIVVKDGVYRNAVWEIDGTGTELEPIVVRAETSGKVVSKGQSAMRISGDYLVVEGFTFTEGYLPGSSVVDFRSLNGQKVANHSRVTGLTMVGYSPPNRGTRLHWVSFYGRHNRLDHSYFSDMNNNGVTVVVWLENDDPEPVYHRIDNNHFANRPEGGENGWETIRIGDSETSLLNSRVTVESNLFTHCDGEIEIISNKACENIFRNNVFFESRGMLTLRHGDRCVVDGNWFFGNGLPGTGGIRVMGRDHVVINNYIERTTGRDGAAITVYPGVGGEDPPINSYFSADRAVIAFNTIVGASGGYFVDLSAKYNQNYEVSSSDIRKIEILPEDVTLANNIFWATTNSSDSFVGGTEGNNFVYEGNVFFGGRTAGSVMPESGYRIKDPEFEDVGGQWEPKVNGNPLAGSAVGTYADVEIDLWGIARGEIKEPGAIQTTGVSGERVIRPTLETTGPDWLGVDRDLRVALWPLPVNYFNGSSEAIVDGFLEVEWLGSVYVNLFPWVYLDAVGIWFYTQGDNEGAHWFFSEETGWFYTDESMYPYLYNADGSWMYLFASGEIVSAE